MAGADHATAAAAFDGPNPSHPQRNVIIQGTLEDPVRDGIVSSSQIKGLPDGYGWAGGGPIRRDPDSGVALRCSTSAGSTRRPARPRTSARSYGRS